jgi:hypothetical protein
MVREPYREEKSTERLVKEVRSIKVELSSEEKLELNPKSSVLEFENLKVKHLKGEIHLNDAEYQALSRWLRDQQKQERDKH